MPRYANKTIAVLALLIWSATNLDAGQYKSFVVSTYVIQGTVQGLMRGNPDPEQSWSVLTRNLKIDKIYLEVMRNRNLVDEAGLDRLKRFFQEKGVQVCGGLAYSVNEAYGFQGFDYADPEDRQFVRQAAELAARHFDEILLDDYFFFNRKTDYDIEAKGPRSWTQFRLETMREVSENLIVKPAKAVNPKCRIVLKMANWYDQYAGMGNDTEKVPFIVDAMFAGTESRLWFGQEQHLQPYLSYNIMRFMDNLKPGVNQGGWVDQGGATPIDRYSEQLVDTVFARCPEMCCFNYAAMIRPISPRATQDRTWSDLPTSLNLAEVLKTEPGEAGITFADVAAYTLSQVDKVLVNVGRPQGIKSYTPHHTTGEEYIHDYLGMIGLPMDILPYFPTDAEMVLITEQARSDPQIISKIQSHLRAGKSVCVTSGFVRAMKGKGIEDIVEIEATGVTVPVRRFTFAGGPGAMFGLLGPRRADQPDPLEAPRDILIPEIKYFNILTHDAWGEALGITAGGTTYPILLSCEYSKGRLYVLTIPNDPADLYALPPVVLSAIRRNLASSEPIRIDSAPAQVALFRYDNETFIVQNYLSNPAEVTVSVSGRPSHIQNLLTGEDVAAATPAGRGFGGMRMGRQAGPQRTTFSFTVLPHSYVAFAVKQTEQP
ncbi:MAG: hypothetical protein QHH07_06640 [Sedimentisphaerales bacterium]|nr:hypothetical protein [Sedimentisphaerales bacterium]